MLRALLCTKNVLFLPRRYVQALYVNSKTLKGNVKILTPILDFEARFANPEEIKENLKRRELSSSFNVDDLLAQWNIYTSIMSKKQESEHQQKEISKLLKEAKKTMSKKPTKTEKDTIRKYKVELETLQKDLQDLEDNFAEADLRFVNNFLSLPNELHDMTPQEVKIISSFGTKVDEYRQNHLAYENVIEYYDDKVYYLKGDAAKFDHTLANRCNNHFQKHQFVQFSNPDFAKTVVVEGAGMDLNDVYEIPHEYDAHHTNLSHLVGNGSMLSFLGFIVALRTYGTLLPFHWVASGKTYNLNSRDDFSLYNTCQSNTVQIFQAGTKDEMLQIFEKTFDVMVQFFSKLDVHFRTVHVPARDLHSSECLAAKIEMYSPHLQKYVEVGNLKYYSNYISKRLFFAYIIDEKNKIIDFPHIISGTACNVTRMLAIILETHNGIIPKKLLDESA